MPEVYGYKTTTKKKVLAEDCKGTLYADWRAGFFRSRLNTKWRNVIRAYLWATVADKRSTPWHRKNRIQRRRPKLVAQLGEDHRIVRLFDKQMRGLDRLGKFPGNVEDMLDRLEKVVTVRRKRQAPDIAIRRMRQRYPLIFDLGGDMSWILREDTIDAWIDYVKLKDKVREEEKP